MAAATGAPGAVVVDTDVFSFLLKRDRRAVRFRPYIGTATILLSFITVGELWKWAERNNWQSKRRNDYRPSYGRPS